MRTKISRRDFMMRVGSAAVAAPALGRSAFAQQAPQAATSVRVGASKSVLTTADFAYLGHYDVTTLPNVAQGLTHRYVNGDLRFLSYGGGGLKEFSLAGKSFGATISNSSRIWQNIGGFSVAGDYKGLWWEESRQRLWTTSATSVTSTRVPTQVYIRTLNDDGTVAGLRGPVSLENINAKRVFGGAQPVPTWFQQQYGVSPYVIGWGGGTSLIMQGGGASIGPTMYAMPDPANFADNSIIPIGAYDTLMDYAPADSRRGTRVTLPSNYLDGGDPRSNAPTPPNFPPQSSGRWLSPRADGKGWWTPCDSYWNTGQWIDTPTKHAFIAVLSGFGGKAYYMSSDVYCDYLQFELHVFDPNHFARVAQGTMNPYSVQPTDMVELMLPGLSNQGTKSHMTPGMAVGGATYDNVGRRLYIMGMGINNFSAINRLYVYQVNC
jgi:hypothetical protein